MTLALSGAEAIISEFGEEVVVTGMDNSVPDNPDNPIFMDSSGYEGVKSTYKVRLYTTPSKEMMEDYGFDEDTQSIMYTTEDIASVGDKVEYEPTDHSWSVSKIATNQIGTGPYIYVYSLVTV